MALSLELIGNIYLWFHSKQVSCLYEPFLFFLEENAGYSNRLHDFSVTISRCYKDVYVNIFFPRTTRLRNFLPSVSFPLTYDLNGFKSRISR